MRTKLTIMALTLALAANAFAASKEKVEERVSELITQFKNMQSDPETKIPPSVLQKAEGLVILHTVKGGFVFGGEAGHGIGIVKDTKTEEWSPIAFIKTVKGSFGFQAGGQASDFVIVMMNPAGTKLLVNPKLKIGGDVQATAGPKSAGFETAASTDKTPVLVYTRSKGAYGGASVEGGGFTPDDKANDAYYGKKGLSMQDILYQGTVKKTPDSEELIRLIKSYSAEETPAAAKKDDGSSGKAVSEVPPANSPDEKKETTKKPGE